VFQTIAETTHSAISLKDKHLISMSNTKIDNELIFCFVCLFLIMQENGDILSLGKLGTNWDSVWERIWKEGKVIIKLAMKILCDSQLCARVNSQNRCFCFKVICTVIRPL